MGFTILSAFQENIISQNHQFITRQQPKPGAFENTVA